MRPSKEQIVEQLTADWDDPTRQGEYWIPLEEVRDLLGKAIDLATGEVEPAEVVDGDG